MTPHAVCLIQEGQAADRQREALAQGLARIARDAFGEQPDAGAVSWRVVREGFGFTAGEPSRSSLVIHSVPAGLPLERREAFMLEVCALWERVTGCSRDEIVVTAWDGPLPL